MKKKLPVALFIGRFQPFHKGHLSAVKWIAKRSSRVIVAIGSAQEEGTAKNPFSAKERSKMMHAQLKSAGLGKKCILAFVTDINDNSKWASHVGRHVPAYEVVYSNNALVKKLMKKAGKKVSGVPFFSKGKYNATKIRERMKVKKLWADRVPSKVKEMLNRMNAEERVRKL